MPDGRVSQCLFACLAALLSFAAASEPDPSAPYRGLHLAAGRTVAGEHLAIGHFDLELLSGILFPIEGESGDRLGFRFDGRARFAYRTLDDVDRQVFEVNAARLGRAKLVHGDHVTADVTAATVLLARPVSLGLTFASGPVPVSPDVARAWRAIATELDDDELAFDQRAALARIDGFGQYAFVALDGPAGRLDYEFDDLEDWEESLSFTTRHPGRLPRLRQTLSRQPIDGGPSRHLKPALLIDDEVQIATDDNRRATIESRLALRIGVSGVRALRFDLVNSRDPRRLGWQSSRNALHVTRVVDEQGRSLPFSHRCHRLLVDLLGPRELGDTIRLEIGTEGDVLTGPDGRASDNLRDLYSVPWYPHPTGWGRAWFNARVRVQTRKPFRPVATGRTTSFREDGDSYELESESDAPGWDLGVFAGTYRSQTLDEGPLRVDVHAYGLVAPGRLAALARRTSVLLDTYTRMLGPLERTQLSLVEYPSPDAGGLSPGGGAILTSYTFSPEAPQAASPRGPGPDALLAHELAHQWFGHQAIPADWLRDNWLVESFAEYAAAVALDSAAGDDAFERMHQGWRRRTARCADLPIAAANDLAGEQAAGDRSCLLYDRGPLVLHMLRAIAGDERFFSILRDYLDSARTAPVTEGDFEATVTRVMGEDLGWFFEQWLRRPGTPRISVTFGLEPGEAGGTVLTGTIGQAGAPRRLHVPLVLEYARGRRERVRVFTGSADQPFWVALGARPERVLVDPEHELLADYR